MLNAKKSSTLKPTVFRNRVEHQRDFGRQSVLIPRWNFSDPKLPVKDVSMD